MGAFRVKRFLGSGLRPALITLFLCLVLSGYFALWLTADTEDERLVQLISRYDNLSVQGKHREAQQLLVDAVASPTNEPLDPIWIQVVQKTDGFVRLELYERLLRSDPENEDLYSSVAKLLELTPEEFREEIKGRYLKNLAEIPDIREDFLIKYNLTLQDIHHK